MSSAGVRQRDYLVPVALLLGEKVTPLFGLGGALVLAGVWVGALAKPREKSGCVERGAAAGAGASAAQPATEGACD